MLSFLFLMLLLIGFLSVLIVLLNPDKPLLEHALSHWHKSVAGLSGTPGEFYAQVKTLIDEQKMPDVSIKNVSFHEGSILSDKRDYLRVTRDDHIYDLCVASFGNTLFISSWLCANPHSTLMLLARMPLFGWMIHAWLRFFDAETYYKIDAGLMFQGAVHAAVLQVLDQMSMLQSVDPLPEHARQPIMRELYGRKTAFA